LLLDTQDNDRLSERKIIAHSSEYQMEILAIATQWHGDGTFKSTPTLIAQNYLIHAWFNDEMWPCVFILTPGRQKKSLKNAA
jgi:hypothetical protein